MARTSRRHSGGEIRSARRRGEGPARKSTSAAWLFPKARDERLVLVAAPDDTGRR